jgi:1-acyl-sn-glycerol-3-phosphate acyltransferase
VVVACNHVSLLDPPILGSVISRESGFVAKKELFAVPGLGRVIRSLNAIPIDRSRLSRETLEVLADFLAGGRVLVLFPEGTRSRTGRLGTAKPGVGVLLARQPAAVVPAYIEGTDAPWRNLFRRGRMRVVFGPPHTLPQELASPSPGRADARRIAESIVEEIRRLGARARPQGDGSPGAPGGGVRPAPAPRSSEFERKGWTPHS